MTTNKFGLSFETIEKIQNVLSRFPKVKKAIIYGSRATGSFREGSDIDLTLEANDLSYSEKIRIEIELDDLLLPYKIDLSDYSKIENEDLRNHIQSVGQVFYFNP